MSEKKIVVVDDEEDLTFLMKEMLKVLPGVEIFIANDGGAGVALCKETKPDLVFLDYVMPKVKGDEVLRQLNADLDLKGTPVVIMSGLGESVYFNKTDDQSIELTASWSLGSEGEIPIPDVAKEHGVVGVLPKPFTKEKLLDVVERVLK